MKQQTLAIAADQNAQYEQCRRPTRRDVFLATRERIVPWAALCAVIEPHYRKAGNGRPPVGLERMLRLYFVQRWFNLADAACEDALLDGTALRRFVGIDLGRERVPDATSQRPSRCLLGEEVGPLCWGARNAFDSERPKLCLESSTELAGLHRRLVAEPANSSQLDERGGQACGGVHRGDEPIHHESQQVHR